MKRVNINGAAYVVRPLTEEDIMPGALVCGRYVRKAYRILMNDNGEWIMRNLRHPQLVDVATTEWIADNCDCMVLEQPSKTS